jgi:formamidopyrimidine-DNA glycosylase
VPELPEVETARRSLHRAVVGRTIARVAVFRPTAVRSHTADGFARALRGAAITDVLRRGKALWFVLDRRVLVFHYMLWGVIRHRPAAAGGGGRAAGSSGSNAAAPPGVSVAIYLDDGSTLEFRDLQLSRFALLRAGAAAADQPEAIEPLAPTTTFQVFRRALGHTGRIKPALTDQNRIAGIGNLWAHEILFDAGLRPDRALGGLSVSEMRALYRKTRQVLRNAVEAGGEPEFQDVFGQRGRYRLMVYGRAGQACRVCGGKIRGGRLGGRPTFFCPSCQR